MHTEIFSPPELEEAASGGSHLARIRGRFIAEGAKSSNRRVYTNTASWIARAQAKIDSGGTVDIRTHHGAEDDTTHIVGHITRLNPEGTYEGVIADTPHGRTLTTLIKSNSLRHVSLRAAGAKVEPIPEESAGEPGWTKVLDLRDFRGIDFTNSPGISFASVAVAESDSGDELLAESFDLEERTFTKDERDKAAKEGAALPDGSFPIYTQKNLDDAVRLVGHAKDPAAARAHIKKRAKQLGLTLPDSWTNKESDVPDDISSILDSTPDEAEGIRETAVTDPDLIALNAEGQAREAVAAIRVREAEGGIAEILSASLSPGEDTAETDGETDGETTTAETTETVESSETAETAEEATETTAETTEPQPVEELGARLSKSSKEELGKALDTLKRLLGDEDPSPSPETQSSTTPEQVTESADVEALVEARIEEKVTVLEERLSAFVAEQIRTATDQLIEARRHSRAVTENAPDLTTVTIKDAIAAALGGHGKTVTEPRPRRSR